MRIIKSLVAITIVASIFSCANQKADVKSLESEIDSVSYAIGLTMSDQLKNGFEDVNKDVLTQAIRNGLDSTNLLLESKEIQNVIKNYFTKKAALQKKEDLLKSEVYKKEGVAFLEANKTKEGVVTTESGLQYIILKEGKGKKPVATSNIKIHYHGMLTDGTVFDSSVDRKKPYDSTANQFIKGFNEGLLLMKEGAKYRFFIPQELAYGPSPRPGVIKPYMALIFEVELLEIKK
ncbi:peptidylprolyl isomerase [Polaribacter sp. SA4-10]|uniref:FKBP-type peptidyl-prolyl cis-trans isomerase n=1 Tax=Polaribacter sp. SA4-10 TaxID=754397 RepID=UPI000B3CCFF4|nr:FKBP-type peptidyl-prolyl cis-trans isomerase [Polaribacter sp. SA4-10]ARV05897.1 peptidylprolyl isomerase [Polaribacter sp. SA4-10]